MNDTGMSTQGWARLVHFHHGCLPLRALSPEQSDPTTYRQKELVHRHSAHHTARHTHKERLPDFQSFLLSTSTIRSPGGWALLLASPFAFLLLSTQAPVDALSSPGFSDPLSLESCKYLPVEKTEGQERQPSWSFKMHNSVGCARGERGLPLKAKDARLEPSWTLLKKTTQLCDVKKHPWGTDGTSPCSPARRRTAGGAQSHVYSSLADANTFLDRHLAEI